jgi:hypothetical protein
MRLSLKERRTRKYVQCRVAGNPGRDDKGEGGWGPCDLLSGWLTAGPSTALRSGRDDNSVLVEKHFQDGFAELQIPRLRSG